MLRTRAIYSASTLAAALLAGLLVIPASQASAAPADSAHAATTTSAASAAAAATEAATSAASVATANPAAHPMIAVTITVSAHRGGAQEEPQNSLLAFQDALAAGVAEVEADTWITSDDVVVVEHDQQLTAPRCTGPYLNEDIFTLTYAELGEMQCGGQPIPTEAQLLQLLTDSSNTTTRLRLESKTYTGETSARIRSSAREVGAAVVAAGLTDRAVMEDFSWDGIAGFHDASPSLRVSALIGQPTTGAVLKAKQLGAYDLSYDAAYSTPYMNAYISGLGLVPTVWNVDPVPLQPGPLTATQQHTVITSARRAVSSGARVLIVNSPELVQSALAQPSQCSLVWHNVADHTLRPSTRLSDRAYYHAAAILPTYEVARLRIAESGHATETAKVTPEGSTSHGVSLHLKRNHAQTVQMGLMQNNAVTVATNYRFTGVTVTIEGLYQRSCS